MGWRAAVEAGGLDSLPRIVRGEGSYLYDTTGRRYLDGSGGPAAFSIGHGNPEVNAAIASQLAQVACRYRYLFSSEPLEELTHLLLTKAVGLLQRENQKMLDLEMPNCSAIVAISLLSARGPGPP